jgi:alpha-L-rhamnosidase
MASPPSRRLACALAALLAGACARQAGDAPRGPGAAGQQAGVLDGGAGATTPDAAQGAAGSGGGTAGSGAAGAGAPDAAVNGDAAVAAGALAVQRLRTEYRANPIGIDVVKPRFDWLLASDRRDQRQTAYQILVASTAEGLAADLGDLWDSGKVQSDRTSQLVYGGKPLQSRQRAWWKVRAWDRDGAPTPWSAPAFWELGLARADLQARWITSTLQAPTLAGARWIWFPEGDPGVQAPAGTRYVRKAFTLPAGAAVTRATCAITADDELELFVNGASLGHQTTWQAVKVFDVTGLLVPGANVLAVRAVNTSASPAGVIARLAVELGNGATTEVVTDATWKAGATAPAGWQAAAFDDGAWAAAQAVATFGAGPWGSPSAPAPPAYFRKAFTVARPKRARVYATALGVYELWLNGKRVGEDLLAPGFTDYRKRLQVQTYDVSDLIKDGANAVGAILADGWFNGKYFVFGRGDFYGAGPNRLLVQLEVEQEDGTRVVVATDAAGAAAWKAGGGPILAADLLDGETYDARRELGDWSSPAFDDAKWGGAQPYTDATPRMLVGDPTDQIQKTQELKPASVKELSPGVFIYDLGQNMVGWARLRVTGAAGATVRLRFAEVLNRDGTLYTTNLRSARATDTYTLRGGAEEVWEPRFTTHGFRYVELAGDTARLAKKPDASTLTGVVVQSRMATTGTFTTSDALTNQLQSNIVWGQRGNFVSVPTDCPQRDERQGWLGDAQVFVRTSTFNMDVAPFFTKWVRDTRDGQTADGAFPEIAPNPDWNRSTPAWGDAGVIVPWTVYLAYGDTRILEEQYAAMVAWVESVRRANPNLLWQKGRGSDYGDWLSIGADTDKEVLATAFFAHSVDLVARSARVLGKTDDATKYAALFASIKTAFNAAYVGADGAVRGDTQTAYALALRFELLPEAARAAAGKRLADDVTRRGVLTTGFIGVAHLLPALTLAGRTDLAYRLLQTDKYPSWLYSVKKGATTIWERWDGIRENGDFQDPGMNSFNHYSFGSVGEWMYANVAGIDLDEAAPAFKHVLIRPRPGGTLTSASAKLDTIHGTVSTRWSLAGKTFTLNVGVPPNTTATVTLPYTRDVRESGAAVQAQPDGSYAIGSGAYVFTASTE